MNILDRLAKGEKAANLAREFGIGNSTVTDLKKNESTIRSFVSTMESLSFKLALAGSGGFVKDRKASFKKRGRRSV